LSSELPSGFKNREEYNKYMREYLREYRKRKKNDPNVLRKQIIKLQKKLESIEGENE